MKQLYPVLPGIFYPHAYDKLLFLTKPNLACIEKNDSDNRIETQQKLTPIMGDYRSYLSHN
jgi:hypothetical protein